ncbi:interleukin-17 receptor D [Oncorhynchus nerka]|uniref:interleukin-17 receptor D n=1 Tax=Oncorhynchus nerka TaxID=8023 RepID=UPI001131F817|nr:interleukin-17 receptor D-like [Oncorhynchus nerka]
MFESKCFAFGYCYVCFGSMRRSKLILLQVLTLSHYLWAQEDLTAISPQDCSLECVLQGGPGCVYCRISREDVGRTLGVPSVEAFGSCVPWPCFVFLGGQSSDVCQHYVHAPHDVTVEFLADENTKYDTVVVSWQPSQFGISFLRGFQVSLQALGGSHMACQLFLFQINISLSASHAQTVYQSDAFARLTLGAQYAVTVMALPVPELWDKFYHSTMFSTRTCPEKNGLEHCKKDWYPKHIEVQQEEHDVIVTFNLAPPHFGINRYFSLCYGEGRRGGGGLKRYIIKPNSTKNRTHHSYHLQGLMVGFNYTCEIAVDEVDAVRKAFNVQVMQMKQDPPPIATPSLTLLLPVGVALAAVLVVLLLAVVWKNHRQIRRKTEINPEIIEQHHDKNGNEEHVSLTSRLTPPRLLICYSSDDGHAHVRAVMQLAVFLQQHMATQVFLDLWDSLSLAEEGIMGWHCRRIQESDFVLVICSRGLQRRPPERDAGESRSTAAAVVSLMGEELGRAKAKGRDISKYMAAIFEYSEEKDIPAELGFVSRYTLTRDLPLLFSHIHGVALHKPGKYLRIEHITEEGYTKLPAGAALQWSIYEAGMALTNHQESCDEWGGKSQDNRVECV